MLLAPFGRVWASKSAALLAAPGVLDPTAIYSCITILHFLPRGGQRRPTWTPNLAMLAICWHIFRSWASFFRSWAFLGRLLLVSSVSWLFCWRFRARPGRFGRVPGGFEESLGGPKALFFDVFSRVTTTLLEKRPSLKNL